MSRKVNFTTVTCPDCGFKLRAGFPATREIRSPFKTQERVRVPKDPNTTSAVDIPFKQAAIGAGYAAVITGAITTLTPWAEYWPKAALVLGSICGAAAFALGVRWDRVKWEIENALQIDLDGDGEIGEPSELTPPPPTKAPDVIVKSGVTGNVRIKHTIPFTNYREARNLARAVLVWGVDFSRRKLTDTNALPDDPDHYSAIYQAMVKADLIKKSKGKNVLTSAGEQYLRKCLTPLPEQ